MGFERFGQVSFTSQTKAGAFVEYLEKGELRGTKCRSCGRVFFPPRADCSFCLSSDMEWFKVEGQGTLVSFTKVNYGPTGFEADVPYILALVDFNGIRVFGRFSKAVPEEQIGVGMIVKAVTSTLSGDQMSYEFLPV
jgi:uncharacterized OB-fold protein